MGEARKWQLSRESWVKCLNNLLSILHPSESMLKIKSGAFPPPGWLERLNLASFFGKKSRQWPWQHTTWRAHFNNPNKLQFIGQMCFMSTSLSKINFLVGGLLTLCKHTSQKSQLNFLNWMNFPAASGISICTSLLLQMESSRLSTTFLWMFTQLSLVQYSLTPKAA